MRPVSIILIFSALSAFAGAYTVEVSGNSQHGRIETVLADPLEIVIRDSSGEPVSGVPVEFEMRSDQGSLAYPIIGEYPLILEGDSASGNFSSVRILTGSDGIAAISLKLGKISSNNTIEATVILPDGSEEEIDFSALAVDLKTIIFQILGGLAIFLLGMKMMSESLQRVAGNKMRGILKKVTSNRFLGLMAGALVTAAIQSSSATSVIAVSFVNSGLIVLKQAVGVIIGANIGTTITGQLIAFKITHYAFPMLTIGFAMLAFSKNRKTQFWGKALTGLALIFIGMTVMKGVLDPLKTSMAVKSFFMTFSTNPLLAILAGTLVTSIIQSSSATVGLTMTLAGAGLINLQGAFYLVLGDNIGTTITAQLSAIGGTRAARQTAMAHTLFNFIGAVYMGLLITNNNGFILNFVRSTSGDSMRQVANAHSMFNIFNALLFLPLVPLLARLCEFIIPDKEKTGQEEIDLTLDENLLDSPSLAIDNLEREMVKMAKYAGSTIQHGISCFMTGSPNPEKIISMEDTVDYMQRDLTIYASKIFQRDLDQDQSLKLPVIIHTINDIERISDHAVNMVEARDRVSGNLSAKSGPLPDAVQEAASTVKSMLDSIETALRFHERVDSQRVLVFEEKLNRLEEDARNYYSDSLSNKDNDGMTGLAMLDFIEYCERIGDHLTNIAQSLLGGGVWHGTDDMH
jgi:phosphate:Na+ symporter